MLKNEKGLTLIELLAVIVILAIVAAIAIPAIGNIIENSRVKAAKADIANGISSANLYFTDYDTATDFTVTIATPPAGYTATTDASSYFAELGTISGLTVTKAADGKLTVQATGKIGSKVYTVDAGTSLSALKVDKGNIADDGFEIGTKD